jgi:quercetin dioxygenase-like cupin family protein
MIIHSAITDLASAQSPIIRILHEGVNSKALVLTFKEGMTIKEHKSNVPATLVVMSGKINFHNAITTVTLEKYDNFSIIPEELHAVTALEDSVCLLLKG